MKMKLTGPPAHAGGCARAAARLRKELFSRPLKFKLVAKVVNGNTVLTYPDRSTITLIGVTHIDDEIFA
jgi:hypothetical protein